MAEWQRCKMMDAVQGHWEVEGERQKEEGSEVRGKRHKRQITAAVQSGEKDESWGG